MQNYKLLIEYDGRGFEGWQRQKRTANTIQETIENAIRTVLRDDSIVVRGAGRTDAGVSALGQVANFFSEEIVNPGRFLYSTNSLLPNEITVRELSNADPKFDARYSAVSRQYIYRCTLKRKSVDCDYYYHIRFIPDAELIRGYIEFASNLNYFRSFCKNKTDKRNFECHINEFTFEPSPNGNELTFTISADRFLHSMIRAVIGCCLDISRGRFNLNEIKNKSLRGEKFNLYYLPPKPLILTKITYSDEQQNH